MKNRISRNIILVIIVIITTVMYFFIVGNNDDNSNSELVKFNADILENNGTSLLVEPDENEDELNSSDKIIVIIPQDGAVLKDLSDFTVGSNVEITYNGVIRESYPAQINAYEVRANSNGNSEKTTNTEDIVELTEEGIIKPESAKKIIEETAKILINAISNKNFQTISEFVHPVKGVRFTPYTHVSADKDVVFEQEKMKIFLDDEALYQWGYYDGKGDEISLTPSQYYEKFIYTADFINAEDIGYNEILSSGNMTENQYEVYENSIVVEFYFSGFNSDYGGADWQSLRLVFEQYESKWKLVGVIHNQWTI